ncbi:hypothetical protein L210DRAFT_3535201 [Boletus edulis BED1]|uniref:Uncharacterized protein n=1 Tax=Boletus edulis BED1 TaxID=1328754 RepID=A0AAD4BYN4_BOLED|nr:hypothetical protein L210DRAFT_3535201 [Boletus edulis BED1]
MRSMRLRPCFQGWPSTRPGRAVSPLPVHQPHQPDEQQLSSGHYVTHRASSSTRYRGRLHHKSEQESVFESLPILNELVSSMTMHINYVRIKREVRQYFRYVILSHRWEDNESLFQQVIHVGNT